MILDLAASFQDSVVGALITTMQRIAADLRPRTLIIAGGVACNLRLKEAGEAMARELELPIYFPSKHLSTDNAAMIAAAGYQQLQNGRRADLKMTADVSMRLQNVAEENPLTRVRYRV